MKIKFAVLITAVIALGSLASRGISEQDRDEAAPVVIKTVPAAGAKDVPAGEYEIRITFSKEMKNESWSWCPAWENSNPEPLGGAYFEPGHRTCVLKVKLKPGTKYGWWINNETYRGFRDAKNRPAVPYLFVFQTK